MVRGADSVVARFTSFGAGAQPQGRGGSGAGAVELSTRANAESNGKPLGAPLLQSLDHFPPLPRLARAPLFTGPELAPKPRDKGSASKGAATAAEVAGGGAAARATGVAAVAVSPSPDLHSPRQQQHPHPAGSKGSATDSSGSLGKEGASRQQASPSQGLAQAVTKSRARSRRRQPQQAGSGSSSGQGQGQGHARGVNGSVSRTGSSGGLATASSLPAGSSGSAQQDDVTPAEFDQLRELAHARVEDIRQAALQLLAGFQQQGFEVASGLDHLQDDLTDLEHHMAPALSEPSTAPQQQRQQGGAGGQDPPEGKGRAEDGGAAGAPLLDGGGAAQGPSAEQMVVLRARREHVEASFLELVRVSVAGLQALAAKCDDALAQL